MKRLIDFIIPPPRWRMPFVILLGIFSGIFLTIFQLSNAISYLSDDSKTCINCHVMKPEYATWMHSSHRSVAVCNDCHVPHENIIKKYYFKANDGLRHATWFTFRWDPQVIRIKEAGKSVVQNNCIRCHHHQVSEVSIANVAGSNYKEGKGLLCWDCHKQIPHGKVHSQASTPSAIIPGLSPPVPEWILKMEKQ